MNWTILQQFLYHKADPFLSICKLFRMLPFRSLFKYLISFLRDVIDAHHMSYVQTTPPEMESICSSSYTSSKIQPNLKWNVEHLMPNPINQKLFVMEI